MKEFEIDFFFSFRSPWSYFATPRIYALQQEYKVNVRLRVVNPIYIRYPEFFDHSHEKWMPYTKTDLIRHAEYLNMPIGMPRPDPINQKLPADSPEHLVLQLNPMGIAAEALGHGIEFAREVSAIIWDGKTDGWNTGDHLAQASHRAGLQLQSIQKWVAANTEQVARQLENNHNALAKHHWGVPTMVFNDEPFFGQDRIELLLWRLKQNGLTARSTEK